MSIQQSFTPTYPYKTAEKTMSSFQSFQTEIISSAGCRQMEEAATMPRGKKDPLWTGIGVRLAELRSAFALTSTEIASSAGVSYSMVLEIENTARVPRVDSAEKIASAIGVCPSWLCFGEDGTEPWKERFRRPIGSPRKVPRANPQTFLQSYRALPDRLRAARDVLGKSLREVSRDSGLSPQTLSTTELGITVPTVQNVEAMAGALGVSPGWLAFGVGRGPGGKMHRTRMVA